MRIHGALRAIGVTSSNFFNDFFMLSKAHVVRWRSHPRPHNTCPRYHSSQGIQLIEQSQQRHRTTRLGDETVKVVVQRLILAPRCSLSGAFCVLPPP